MDTILAIDHGTQSCRALLFDPQGNLLAKHKVEIEPYYSTEPGFAEQDPQVFWNALCEACQGLWQMEGVEKSSVKGVSLTTQRSTVLALDENGTPLRDAIVWPDDRRVEGLPNLGGFWGAAFRVAGATETVNVLRSQCESVWLEKFQPEIWKKTKHYLYLSGYLTFLLTGEFNDSISSQVGYVPFDYKALTWEKKWGWKWQVMPMDEDMLPNLIPAGDLLGTITPEAAEATGIPVGLPLVASAADKATEVLGAGCVHPNMACLSYGTTATINTTHAKYYEIYPMIPPYPAAVPGQYTMELQIYRGYWMVSWFKKEFGLREQRLADEQGILAEDLFDDLLQAVPAGSEGLMLQPYWTPGIKVPGPEARGSIIGFSDVHTRAHIYRAIIEGLAYALREGAEQTEKRTKVALTDIRVAGGGSQSEAAMQITADIFGKPVSRPHLYEASGLGAAINGMVGLGIHSDYESAVEAMTRVKDTFYPNPEVAAMYNELYEDVYLKLYKQVQPLYKKIKSISAKY